MAWIEGTGFGIEAPYSDRFYSLTGITPTHDLYTAQSKTLRARFGDEIDLAFSQDGDP